MGKVCGNILKHSVLNKASQPPSFVVHDFETMIVKAYI